MPPLPSASPLTAPPHAAEHDARSAQWTRLEALARSEGGRDLSRRAQLLRLSARPSLREVRRTLQLEAWATGDRGAAALSAQGADLREVRLVTLALALLEEPLREDRSPAEHLALLRRRATVAWDLTAEDQTLAAEWAYAALGTPRQTQS